MGALIISCLLSFNGAVNPVDWCENALWSLEVNQERIAETYYIGKGGEIPYFPHEPNQFEVASCLIDNTIEECAEFSEY